MKELLGHTRQSSEDPDIEKAYEPDLNTLRVLLVYISQRSFCRFLMNICKAQTCYHCQILQ